MTQYNLHELIILPLSLEISELPVWHMMVLLAYMCQKIMFNVNKNQINLKRGIMEINSASQQCSMECLSASAHV